MNVTKLYVLTDLEKLKVEDVLKFASFMPKERMEKFERTIKKEKKIELVVSYMLLLFTLKKNNILNKSFNFNYNYNSNKRPAINLKENKKLFFNISHSNNIIVLGMSYFKIGVDVEKIKNFNLKLAKKICTRKEFLKFSHSFKKKETFFLIWTKKEAFCKLKLKSIFFNFKLINSFKLKNSRSFKFKNYIISINCRCNKNIVFEKVNLKELLNFESYL